MMRAFPVVLLTALVSTTMAASCAEFQPLQLGDDAGSVPSNDAGTDASTTPPPERDAGGIPLWNPTYQQPGPGEVLLQGFPTCPALGALGGTIQGSYNYQSGCFDQQKFLAVFEQHCPGIRVTQSGGKLSNGSGITVDDNMATQRGHYWVGAEVDAPCRDSVYVRGDCGNLAGYFDFALREGGSNATATAPFVCYDTGQACLCRFEIDGEMSSATLTVDPSAGTLTGNSRNYLYSASSPTVFELMGNDSDEFAIDGALQLKLAR